MLVTCCLALPPHALQARVLGAENTRNAARRRRGNGVAEGGAGATAKGDTGEHHNCVSYVRLRSLLCTLLTHVHHPQQLVVGL